MMSSLSLRKVRNYKETKESLEAKYNSITEEPDFDEEAAESLNINFPLALSLMAEMDRITYQFNALKSYFENSKLKLTESEKQLIYDMNNFVNRLEKKMPTPELITCLPNLAIMRREYRENAREGGKIAHQVANSVVDNTILKSSDKDLSPIQRSNKSSPIQRDTKSSTTQRGNKTRGKRNSPPPPKKTTKARSTNATHVSAGREKASKAKRKKTPSKGNAKTTKNSPKKSHLQIPKGRPLNKHSRARSSLSPIFITIDDDDDAHNNGDVNNNADANNSGHVNNNADANNNNDVSNNADADDSVDDSTYDSARDSVHDSASGKANPSDVENDDNEDVIIVMRPESPAQNTHQAQHPSPSIQTQPRPDNQDPPQVQSRLFIASRDYPEPAVSVSSSPGSPTHSNSSIEADSPMARDSSLEAPSNAQPSLFVEPALSEQSESIMSFEQTMEPMFPGQPALSEEPELIMPLEQKTEPVFSAKPALSAEHTASNQTYSPTSPYTPKASQPQSDSHLSVNSALSSPIHEGGQNDVSEGQAGSLVDHDPQIVTTADLEIPSKTSTQFIAPLENAEALLDKPRESEIETGSTSTHTASPGRGATINENERHNEITEDPYLIEDENSNDSMSAAEVAEVVDPHLIQDVNSNDSMSANEVAEVVDITTASPAKRQASSEDLPKPKRSALGKSFQGITKWTSQHVTCLADAFYRPYTGLDEDIIDLFKERFNILLSKHHASYLAKHYGFRNRLSFRYNTFFDRVYVHDASNRLKLAKDIQRHMLANGCNVDLEYVFDGMSFRSLLYKSFGTTKEPSANYIKTVVKFYVKVYHNSAMEILKQNFESAQDITSPPISSSYTVGDSSKSGLIQGDMSSSPSQPDRYKPTDQIIIESIESDDEDAVVSQKSTESKHIDTGSEPIPSAADPSPGESLAAVNKSSDRSTFEPSPFKSPIAMTSDVAQHFTSLSPSKSKIYSSEGQKSLNKNGVEYTQTSIG